MAGTPLTDAINALTTYSNTVTGASDTTLSDAVATLASGYGGGGGNFATGTITPTGSSNTITFDTGLSTINGLLVLPVENPLGRGSRICVGVIITPSGFYYQSLRIPTNSSGSSINAPTGYTSESSFTQSGTTVTVNGTYNFGNFEYRWLAW